MPGQVEVALLNIDMQIDRAPGGRSETICRQIQITSNAGKQIARLWMWIMPERIMALRIDLAGFDKVAVRE